MGIQPVIIKIVDAIRVPPNTFSTSKEDSSITPNKLATTILKFLQLIIWFLCSVSKTNG